MSVPASSAEAEQHLAKSGVIVVRSDDHATRSDIEAAGHVDVTALLRKWTEESACVHESWTSLRRWMEMFNVHLKRSPYSFSGDTKLLTWWNGIVNCGEELLIRMQQEGLVASPKNILVFNVSENARGVFQLALETNSKGCEFIEWLQQRLTFKDPGSGRQAFTLPQQQQPLLSLLDPLQDECFALNVTCVDRGLIERLGLLPDGNLRARLRKLIRLQNVELNLVGVQTSEHGYIHLLRMVKAVLA